MAKVTPIAGRATRARIPEAWAKGPGDQRPCLICQEEGHFIPVITIWRKDDPQHVGNFYVVVLPIVLCPKHASTDPREYKPHADTVAQITAALAGEPDLITMMVQFMGNSRCRVDHAQELAAQQAGLYAPPSPARKL